MPQQSFLPDWTGHGAPDGLLSSVVPSHPDQLQKPGSALPRPLQASVPLPTSWVSRRAKLCPIVYIHSVGSQTGLPSLLSLWSCVSLDNSLDTSEFSGYLQSGRGITAFLHRVAVGIEQGNAGFPTCLAPGTSFMQGSFSRTRLGAWRGWFGHVSSSLHLWCDL